ncbi:MAG: serine/threonine protein kinase [Opitutae bacterium]|nr:serine/threonine protein kinase [Opitutae bacterium]
MSELNSGSGELDVPPSADAAASGATPCPETTGGCPLAAGLRWRSYQIEGPLEPGPANAFTAMNVGLMERVLIRAVPVTDATEWRRGAWERLAHQLPADARVLPCLEAFEEDGWRYEVSQVPPTATLREWFACHKADYNAVKSLLSLIAKTLGALHAQGVVHLNLRTDTIHIDDSGDHVQLVFGGLEAATLYTQSDLGVLQPDFFYAPPEAAEKSLLRPGTALCAWDWWSVGRILQEFVLGRHVMSVLFGADITQPTPELRTRAEALLREREPPGLRAGAVEAMGPIDKDLKVLLRGLLSGAPEARWGGDAVKRWSAGEKVSNHYDLARNARFFAWKGRALSLPEAAEFFSTEENWAEGEENLFDPGNAETLAHFLSTVPAHHADWQKLQQLYVAAESPEWGGVPPVASRTVIAAAAWLTLGRQPGSLILRGRSIDAAGLAGLLSNPEDFYHCALVLALMSAPFLRLIEKLDPAATGLLRQLGQTSHEALRAAETHGWLAPGDIGAQARLLQLSLEPAEAMRARVERIRSKFASCRDAELARLLTEKQPAHWAEVVLAFTSEQPDRFGYITTEEYARQRLAELEDHGRRLRAAVFWLGARRALRVGTPITGSWRIFLGFWLAVVAVGGLVVRDPGTTLWLALGLLALRGLVSWRVGRVARRIDRSAMPWGWRDNPERGVTEARRSWPEASAADLPRLKRQLAGTLSAMQALRPEAPLSATCHAPELTEVWLGHAAAALVCFVGFFQLAMSYYHPDATPLLVRGLGKAERIAGLAPAQPSVVAPAARTPGKSVPLLPDLPGLPPGLAEKIASGEYELVKDGFGRTVRGPLTKWDLAPPAVVASLPVESRAPATPAQRAFALVSGELLLQPYAHNAVNALLIIRVPTKDGYGLMMYSARDRKLLDGDTLYLRNPVADRTWYRFDQRNVVYLGVPAELENENSLALK